MQDNAFRYPHISRTIPPEGGHIGYKDWKYIWYVQGFRDENPVQNFSVGGVMFSMELTGRCLAAFLFVA